MGSASDWCKSDIELNIKEEKQNITELAPIPSEPPEADQKIRRLTDDEIIQGFRYLMNKDKKKD